MMIFLGWLCFGLAAVGILWLLTVWNGCRQAWLPPELAGAKLVMVETNLRVRAPYPVSGRPDRIYQLPDGLCVPLEEKNRDKAEYFPSDVAQLSLQAWLLRQKGIPTATFGYVMVQLRRSGERKCLCVSLWSDARCEKAIALYIDLIAGRRKPMKNVGRRCNTCGHRPVCERDAA
jgi:hypothetical protein